MYFLIFHKTLVINYFYRKIDLAQFLQTGAVKNISSALIILNFTFHFLSTSATKPAFYTANFIFRIKPKAMPWSLTS